MKDSRVRYYAENMERLSRRDRILLNNPAIMQGLGLACIVVPATNLQNALILALGVLMLLTPTRMVATFIGRHTGFKFRAVLYVLIAGLTYIPVAYVLDTLFGAALSGVGIYLPLLCVEPLILKRYESPKRERVSTSLKKGLNTTVGFCLVLFLVAGIRELLALGTLGGILIFEVGVLPLMGMPAGGFICMGLLAAIWRAAVNTFKKRVSLGVKELS